LSISTLEVNHDISATSSIWTSWRDNLIKVRFEMSII